MVPAQVCLGGGRGQLSQQLTGFRERLVVADGPEQEVRSRGEGKRASGLRSRG